MRKTYSPLTAEELADYNKLVDSPNKINPSSVFLSSPTTSTDHAELGGSTSPTAPLLALECGVAAPTLGTSLPGYPSPTMDPLAAELSTTATDEAVGEVGVGGASSTEPICLLPYTTTPPPELPVAAQGDGEGSDATLSHSPAPAVAEDHDDIMGGEALCRPGSPHVSPLPTVGDLEVDAVALPGSGGPSPAPTPQAGTDLLPAGSEDAGSLPQAAPASPTPLAGAVEMHAVGNLISSSTEEQATPPVTPTATYTEEVTISVDTTTLAVGEMAPAVTAAPIKAPRRSSRNAATADVHTLHKAERPAAKKNLEFPGNSFTSFPDSKVLSNLGRVGINLGTSDVVTIKNLEVDRLVLCANTKKGSAKSKLSNLESDDERDDQIDAILSHACGNLNENLLEEENDQIIDLSPLRRKKKYNNAKNTVNGKLPKKPKTPSKIIIK